MAATELAFSVRTRRTSRVTVRIPLRIAARDSSGAAEEIAAWTLVVNEHGARCECFRSFEQNQIVGIANPVSRENATGTIVWCGSTPDAAGKFEFAVELHQPANLWQINFPPGDWISPRDVMA